MILYLKILPQAFPTRLAQVWWCQGVISLQYIIWDVAKYGTIMFYEEWGLWG